jgi:hypothetical protein
MWLSGAHSAANRASGLGKAAATKQGKTVARQATRLWTDAWIAAVKPKGRR